MATWWLRMFRYKVEIFQELGSSGADEPYLIAAACDWRDRDNPVVNVKYSPAGSVSDPRYPYRYTNLNIWGTQSSYKPFHILKSAFFAQAMERDFSNRTDMVRKIKSEMLGFVEV